MASLPSAKRSRLLCLTPAKGEYCRAQQLPPLLRLWPNQVEDYSYSGTLKLAAMLRKSLRNERNRARAGHWAYDLNRHVGLIEALKCERARLAALAPTSPRQAMAIKPEASRPRSRGTLHLPSPEHDRQRRAALLGQSPRLETVAETQTDASGPEKLPANDPRKWMPIWRRNPSVNEGTAPAPF